VPGLGIDGIDKRRGPFKFSQLYSDSGGASRFFYCAKASRTERGKDNKHPTVKPVALMEYLCKLITPLGGLILDPFMGSGTTGMAAKKLGFRFVGIEKDAGYYRIAEKRIAAIMPGLFPGEGA
jgi:site-specific DNA-methyltransferase (adenine-specific)